MRAVYRTHELMGKECPDYFVTIEKFNEIMEACHTNYEYFLLKEDAKDSVLLQFKHLCNGKFMLYKGALVYNHENQYPEWGIFYPKQIVFYDVYSKNAEDRDVYSLVCIGNKLELRHSLKGKFKAGDTASHESARGNVRTRVKHSIKVLLRLVLEQKEKRERETNAKLVEIDFKLDLATPLKLFKELGYIKSSVDDKELITTLIKEELLHEDDISSIAKKNLNRIVYEFISNGTEYTDKCVWCDFESLDPSDQYIVFMQQLGTVSRGELKFSDISLSIDPEGYEQINFTVNGVNKSWRLEKPGYIDAEFFCKFAELTDEFKTLGKYTSFGKGQAFVVDYATEEEQIAFAKRTKIKRTWLD